MFVSLLCLKIFCRDNNQILGIQFPLSCTKETICLATFALSFFFPETTTNPWYLSVVKFKKWGKKAFKK